MEGVAEEVDGALSAELLRIAKMNPGNAERDLHPILLRNGLELPMTLTELSFGSASVHVVRISTWFSYVLEHKPSVLLAGFPQTHATEAGEMLAAFWEAYKFEEPDHQVFQQHQHRLRSCVPFYLFSDDGRSLRKSKLLVLSFETPFGRETASQVNEQGKMAAKKKPKHARMLEQRPQDLLDAQYDNGRLSSFLSRFLYCVVPHGSYTDEVYMGLLHDIAVDCKRLFEQGVRIQGTTWFGVCLGMKGDAPALAKAGRLVRSFYHDTEDGGPICAYCLAGTTGYPYSDTSQSAAWRQSMWASRPWDQPSPLALIPTEDPHPEVFYKADPFHTFLLGLGRYFLASSIIMLGQLLNFTVVTGSEKICVSTVSLKLWGTWDLQHLN